MILRGVCFEPHFSRYPVFWLLWN